MIAPAHRKSFANDQRGFGIVEGILVSGVLFIIVAAFSQWLARTYSQDRLQQSRESCQGIAATLVDAIRVHDNALIVRNYALPDMNHRRMATVDQKTADPFCEPGRLFLCDTMDHFKTDAVGNIDMVGFANGQNIRGATAWAMSLFNTHLSAICSGEGKSYSGEVQLKELGQVFPYTLEIPAGVTTAGLKIQPVIAGVVATCSQPVLAKPSGEVSFHVELHLKVKAGDSSDQSCSAGATLQYAVDPIPPQILSTNPGAADLVVKNGFGSIVPPGQCTCTLPYKPGDPNALPAKSCVPEMRTVTVEMLSTEPGSLFLCAMSEPSVRSETYCGAMGGMSLLDGSVVTINKPTAAKLEMPDLSDGTYAIAVRTVDVGGNPSGNSMPAGFKVAAPVCPDPDTVTCNEKVIDPVCGIDCGTTGKKNCPKPTNPSGDGICFCEEFSLFAPGDVWPCDGVPGANCWHGDKKNQCATVHMPGGWVTRGSGQQAGGPEGGCFTEPMNYCFSCDGVTPGPPPEKDKECGYGCGHPGNCCAACPGTDNCGNPCNCKNTDEDWCTKKFGDSCR